MPHNQMTRLLLLTSILLLTGCAENADRLPEAEDEAELQEGRTPAAGASLNVYQKPSLGRFLVDADSMSLYLFKADSTNVTTCLDECADAWPPFTAQGEVQTGNTEVQRGLIGTTTRRNGSMQVTYNGWPLYYYALDNQPGDTKGQDIMDFGAEWYLVTPDGNELHAEGSGH